MTWKELVRETAKRANISLRQAEKVLGAFLATLSDQMTDAEFERLTLPRIGTFVSQWSPPRVVRAPHDRKRLYVDGRFRISFRTSKVLQEQVAAHSSQHWRSPAHQAGWRLAETLVSDLELYHPGRNPSGVRFSTPDGDVRAAAAEVFGVHWVRAVRTYDNDVAEATRAEHDHLTTAVRSRWAAAPTARERRADERRRLKTTSGSGPPDAG
jgi:nucleoid DNA-binding protein